MIASEILAALAVIQPEILALEKCVDPILRGIAEDRRGLFFGRPKSGDSVFEKLVIGEYLRPLTEMEDLYAATIVLPQMPEGASAKEFQMALEDRFQIKDVRTNRTKKPAEFIYDDLHYILCLKDSALLANKKLLVWKFELQVKSILQHGWAVASRGLAYKSKKESWRASRVVAQTKALVELAEAALRVGEDQLAPTAEREYKPIDDRTKISGMLVGWWKGEFPEDRRRLARFVAELVSMAGLSIERFEELLKSSRGIELAGRTSISIHQAVLILLIENDLATLLKGIAKPRHQGDSRRYLLVTADMEAISPKCKEVPVAERIALTA